ncbi:squalene-associated FAD-dependent desaturase [Andreprevotia lacus DSM 23236]|jgi:squalene-associated FAD-dependent desaturase|uniref:Squalene-associated FAD-dependent desaturase n=1 Tax=Andreprevotia lacus DSM 23236 TaxID=1121001 RepID=A0A1W1XZI5_9NEIS|nr:hydroxysqualene dehydroxylase HpnE [Andreprevotia lacus]SMC29294.1 squalene-associated FAD-dependent desaturase [Andreprevotia lacus DSM 23236]
MTTRQTVAVLGGGYAGMAAATALAAAGRKVCVFEAGPVLGGRARRISIDGREIDNGQHLLIGGYTTLLDLMTQVGVAPETAFLRTPMDLRVLPDFHLRCASLPAPLHLALGLLRAKGLSWAERWALIRAVRWAQGRNWRLQADLPAADWLLQQRQPTTLIESFWRPLTVAALNTPLEAASTQVLFNTLRDSLGGARAASDLLFPRLDFSALFPDAAARFVQSQGGEVRLGTTIRGMVRTAGGWQIEGEHFDAVVCALPPHRLGMALADVGAAQAALAQLTAWDYQPIVTLYLQYAADVALPQPMVGVSSGLAQWVFDRNHTHGMPGLIAVVLSARGAHSALSQQELTQAIAAEMRQWFGWGEPTWTRVISEKRATFACTPNLPRPANATDDPTLWLAGDYTAGDYPATLEGAVRSGLIAARGIIAATELENQA